MDEITVANYMSLDGDARFELMRGKEVYTLINGVKHKVLATSAGFGSGGKKVSVWVVDDSIVVHELSIEEYRKIMDTTAVEHEVQPDQVLIF